MLCQASLRYSNFRILGSVGYILLNSLQSKYSPLNLVSLSHNKKRIVLIKLNKKCGRETSSRPFGAYKKLSIMKNEFLNQAG